MYTKKSTLAHVVIVQLGVHLGSLLPYLYLGQPSNKKFIVIFRNPAERAWAAWNFWMYADDAVRRQGSDWAHAPVHYRSPEVFHELMVAGDGNSATAQFLNSHHRSAYVVVP